MGFISDIYDAQERLKKRIHAFRYPLSPPWYRLAICTYIALPVIGGYYVMQYTNKQVELNIGKDGKSIRSPYGFNDSSTAQNAMLQEILNRERDKRK